LKGRWMKPVEERSDRPQLRDVEAEGLQGSLMTRNALTAPTLVLQEGERRCGTVRGATTRGGSAKITWIGRSWVNGPAVAAALAHLARPATRPGRRARDARGL